MFTNTGECHTCDNVTFGSVVTKNASVNIYTLLRDFFAIFVPAAVVILPDFRAEPG